MKTSAELKVKVEFYTPTEFSTSFGITRKSVYSWMDKEIIPYIVTVGGSRLPMLTRISGKINCDALVDKMRSIGKSC